MAAKTIGSAWLIAMLVMTALPGAAGARIIPGIDGAINFTTLDYNDEVPVWSSGWRYTLGAGFTAEFPLAARVSFLSGLRYVKFGNKVKFDTGPGDIQEIGEFRIIQGYFAVPLTMQFRPVGRWLLTVGPEAGFLATAKLDVEETAFIYGEVQRLKTRVDVRESLESTNLWLQGGVGYEIPLESHMVVLRARYLHGFTDVAEPDSWGVQWQTRGIEVTAGVWW